jgi:hypothetical protein
VISDAITVLGPANVHLLSFEVLYYYKSNTSTQSDTCDMLYRYKHGAEL